MIERPVSRAARIALLLCQILADHALDENSGAIDGAMASDVGHTLVHVDQLEVAGGFHRCRKDDSKLFQPGLGVTHRATLRTPREPRQLATEFERHSRTLAHAIEPYPQRPWPRKGTPPSLTMSWSP